MAASRAARRFSKKSGCGGGKADGFSGVHEAPKGRTSPLARRVLTK